MLPSAPRPSKFSPISFPKPVCFYRLTNTCYMPRPAVQTIQPLSMLLPHPSTPNISITPSLKSRTPCSTLNVTNQALHLYKNCPKYNYKHLNANEFTWRIGALQHSSTHSYRRYCTSCMYQLYFPEIIPTSSQSAEGCWPYSRSGR
jgi:hypothetical protein